MSIISKQYNPKIGPIIQVVISAPGDIERGSRKIVLVNLLVDTGAGMSGISPEIANRVGIDPTSKINIQTPTGVAQVNCYYCDIAVLHREISPDSGSIHQSGVRPGQMTLLKNHKVIEFSGSTNSYSGLLGRDIICMGYLHIGFDQRFLFAI